jgi:transposase
VGHSSEGEKPWQMWCLTAPKAVVHRIRDDKGADTFRSLMSGYEGVIVCDALKTHEAGARGNDAIALAGCWAHVFRKFEDAAPDHPEANLALKWIGELYAIDESAESDLPKKAELRKAKSTEVMATMKTWLWNQPCSSRSPSATPPRTSSPTGTGSRAFSTTHASRWITMRRSGAIRGPVVGRKNHYGSKSRRGTEVAAIFYTVLETAKLEGVGPAKYLREAALADARGELLLPADIVI